MAYHSEIRGLDYSSPFFIYFTIMALTKKAVNDHFLHSFGQIDEPVRSRTGNDGLIIGGVCENSGTVTAVEHGDFAALHFDNDQNLNVNIAAGEVIASLGTVDLLKAGTIGQITGGGVAANAADSGNPLKVGGKYTLAGVTLDDGDRGDLSLDSKSNANINMNTQLAGEDLTVNGTTGVICTENRYSYYHYVGTAGAVVGTAKASAGFLHSININTAGTSPVTVYDSVGTSATVIGILGGTNPITRTYNVICATGITLAGTSAIDVTISFR